MLLCIDFVYLLNKAIYIMHKLCANPMFMYMAIATHLIWEPYLTSENV